MSGNSLLVAKLPLAAPAPLPIPIELRGVGPNDIYLLADLWMRAYPPAITADETPDSARADFAATFDGEYGDLVEGASLVTRDGSAAILTVDRAPWDDAPDCPFVIELFVDPSKWRTGLSRTLLRTAASALVERGDTSVALRVDLDNAAARALYAAEGFARR